MKLNKTILAIVTLAILAVIPTINSVGKDKDVVVLNDQNTVSINEEVSAASVAKWVLKAKELDSQGPANKPIYLVMNTPGGSIEDGLMLIEALKGLRRPVSTVTIFAASMGFQIVENMGERLILKNGVLMSHHANGEVAGDFGGIRPGQLESRLQIEMDIVQELDQQAVDRTNGKQTLESYQKSYDHELWMTGSKSVEKGYADKVTTLSCDKSLNGTSSHEASFMGIPIKYELSNCPLITGPLSVKLSVHTNKGVLSEDEFLQKGGQFGASCLLNQDPNKLCSMDTTLDLSKLSDIKRQFTDAYIANKTKVVYMYFRN